MTRTIALLALACLASACANKSTPPPAEEPGGKVCTMEAKLCPDGSAVGRTGPNCEFAPCPGPGEPAAEAPAEPNTSPEAAAPSP